MLNLSFTILMYRGGRSHIRPCRLDPHERIALVTVLDVVQPKGIAQSIRDCTRIDLPTTTL